MLGTHELFCKRVNQLSLGWSYTNLPNDFEQYYKAYNRDIKDDSFRLKLPPYQIIPLVDRGQKSIKMFRPMNGKTLQDRLLRRSM